MPLPIIRITTDRIIIRETAVTERGRPIIIELHPGYMILRCKGQQQRVAVDYGAILALGYRIQQRAAQAERATKRARP